MTLSVTPTARAIVRRASRWRAPRFLKVCWLVVTGRKEILVGPGMNVAAADVGRLERLPHVAAVIAAMKRVCPDRDGLRRLIVPHALEWFRELEGRVNGASVREDAARAWLERAAHRKGHVGPLDRLLESALRRIDGDGPCGRGTAVAGEAGVARCGRQHTANPASRQRESGRLRLLRDLCEHVLARLKAMVPSACTRPASLLSRLSGILMPAGWAGRIRQFSRSEIAAMPADPQKDRVDT
ncbi:MAG: hypothetical protein KDG54_17140 [Geminicoccaceae bacterium]|nr:hypothetical protein [Geminicoccaceae bacterium]